MGETGRGLHTRSEDHLLSFLTPTQTYISDVHRHSYGYFGTTTCGVNGLLENWVIKQVGAFGTFMDNSTIMTQ
jgi:hypothetical protein